MYVDLSGPYPSMEDEEKMPSVHETSITLEQHASPRLK